MVTNAVSPSIENSLYKETMPWQGLVCNVSSVQTNGEWKVQGGVVEI